MDFDTFMTECTPNTIHSYIGNKPGISTIRAYLQCPPYTRPLLVSSMSGIGTHLSLRLIANDLAFQISQYSKSNDLYEVFTKKESILSFYTTSKSIIVLNEFDRTIYEIYLKSKCSLPVIIVNNHVPLCLRKKCIYVQYTKPTLHEINTLFNTILANYSVKISKDDLHLIVKNSYQDIRQGLHSLFLLIQRLHDIKSTTTNHKRVLHFIENVSYKDHNNELEHKLLLKIKESKLNEERKLQLIHKESHVIMGMIFENYLKLSLDISTVSDIISMYSFYDSYLHTSQIDEETNYFKKLCIMYPLSLMSLRDINTFQFKNELLSHYNTKKKNTLNYVEASYAIN
jgi:hypothetical protein